MIVFAVMPVSVPVENPDGVVRIVEVTPTPPRVVVVDGTLVTVPLEEVEDDEVKDDPVLVDVLMFVTSFWGRGLAKAPTRKKKDHRIDPISKGSLNSFGFINSSVTEVRTKAQIYGLSDLCSAQVGRLKKHTVHPWLTRASKLIFSANFTCTKKVLVLLSACSTVSDHQFRTVSSRARGHLQGTASGPIFDCHDRKLVSSRLASSTTLARKLWK